MNSAADIGQANDSRADGKMIVVCSAVGGAGKTAVTVNLAALLAEQDIKTTIVDADLQFGDVALALDAVPYITVKEAAEQNRMKAIRDFCIDHKSGIRLLAAPVRPEYAELITAEAFTAAVDILREDSDVLIAETPQGLAEQNLLLMDQADQILVITTPGMSALKNTRLMIETLSALGMSNKIRLIVNKSDAPTIMEVSDIPRLLNISDVSLLPDDPKRVSFSMDTGVPLVFSHPHHGFSRQLRKLAEPFFRSHVPEGKSLLDVIRKKVTATRIRGENDEFTGETAIKKLRRSHQS